eukprot:CAMPEP_0173377992 /NCGR_PEP_ID=MMETSP1356-20130122/1231_1 /TAXON_ID=77927 ORGANISM="Hemiselmis virescens, Strain PCC157" /NCGR_SAMPLE_ID=MMETSP1356 /ASSEMBLY_ACC=CAM_ASM_000847 /LENGTH=384 /DNA_ID=CAMNT_0014330929 /DNA_START=31 /DNA_END=1185 /DNA_ORIENTATION=-
MAGRALLWILAAIYVANAAADLSQWEKEQLITGMAKFTTADLDSDGILSKAEFEIMGKTHYEELEDQERRRFDPKKIAESLDAEFSKYDRDGNKLLTKEEWQKVTEYHITRTRDDIITEKAFKKADADANGQLTIEEVQAHFGPQGYKKEELDSMFFLGDLDKDEILTLMEFKSGRADFQTLMEHERELQAQEEKEKLRLDAPNEEAVVEFKKHDTNNNGVLAPQEFINLIRSQVNTIDPKTGEFMDIPEEGIIKAFKKYDTNKDISVSLEEWTHVINATVQDAHAVHDFDEADQNKDGKLSLNEYTILFEALATVMGQKDKDGKMAFETYKRHDLDGDGQLTSNEYLLSVQILKAEADLLYDKKMAEEREREKEGGGEAKKEL